MFLAKESENLSIQAIFRLLLTFNIRILQYLEKILLIVVVVAFFSFRTTIFYRIEYSIANRRVAIANFKIVAFATKGINYAKRERPVNEPINECNHVNTHIHINLFDLYLLTLFSTSLFTYFNSISQHF